MVSVKVKWEVVSTLSKGDIAGVLG